MAEKEAKPTESFLATMAQCRGTRNKCGSTTLLMWRGIDRKGEKGENLLLE